MTKIVHIKCPKCGSPVFTKDVDAVVLCGNCGTMHAAGTAEVLDYETGQFTRPGDGERLYLPVWVAAVQYHINDISIQGGGVTNLFGILPAQSKDGTLMIYVPASVMEPMQFKDTALEMTGHPPKYAQSRLEPGVHRAPCTVTVDELQHLCEFIFVTGIAEKPGVLQRLDYGLIIGSKKLLYLPYYKKDESYQPGY